MNYSTYFENKVAAVFNNKINLTVLSVSRLTDVETIVSSVVTTVEQAQAYIAVVDPFNVIMSGQDITVKILDDAQKEA